MISRFVFNISNQRSINLAVYRHLHNQRIGWIKRANCNNGSSCCFFVRHFVTQPPNPSDAALNRWSKLKPINMWTFAFSVVCGGSLLGYLYYLEQKKTYEEEKQRKLTIGRSLVGGPWELVSADGQLMSEKDFFGKWVLIYFGFTHCPDICPDELEKMALVIEKLEKEKRLQNGIAGLFFTVDPERDTPERIKRYVEEFSPKMIGFTGSREQVNKVCKTFRVYHSAGPKDNVSDYIVDHTIITYLMDPEGNFTDYFGQKRSVNEVVDAIHGTDVKYMMYKKKQKFFDDKEKENKDG